MATLPLTIVAATLVFGAVGAHAQARAILLPDTLGANFSVADTARARGSATDFDFLLGSWQFTFQSRRPDGTFNAPFTGHWSAFKKSVMSYQDGGRDVQTILVEDQWRNDDSTTVASSGVYTWRAWNSQRPLWLIQGLNTWEAAWEPGLAWSDGANRYLIQHRGPVIVRIRYFGVSGNTFLWRSDRSTDGGRTWLLDSGTMQAQRLGR